MPGIVTTHSIDKKYFEEGEAYKLLIPTNNYRVNRTCILSEVTNNSVTFTYIELDKVCKLTLSLDDLIHNNDYSIVKLKPDYNNGVFEYSI